MSIGEHRHCCIVTVSVTYENERISIKNSLLYLKCVLRLSCVNTHLKYGKLFFIETLSFSYVTETVGFFPYKSLYFECRCSPMLIFRAWGSCGTKAPFFTVFARTSFNIVMITSRVQARQEKITKVTAIKNHFIIYHE